MNDFLSEANAEISSISAEEAKKNSNDIYLLMLETNMSAMLSQ